MIKNNQTVFAAQMNGKLYEVILYKANIQSVCLSYNETNAEQNLWHFRMGHLNVNDMKRLIDHNMASGLDKIKIERESEFCESCVLGKQTRLPFANKKERRSNRILELIHSDVCGPMKQSAHDGANYFVTFTDDFSRATMVYCIKHKSDVIEKFREFIEMAEAQKCVLIMVANIHQMSSNDCVIQIIV